MKYCGMLMLLLTLSMGCVTTGEVGEIVDNNITSTIDTETNLNKDTASSRSDETDSAAEPDIDIDTDTDTDTDGDGDTDTDTDGDVDTAADIDTDSDVDIDGDADADTDGDADADSDADSDGDGDMDGGALSDGGAETDEDSDICESASVSAEVDPVYLAFAFDVSGSMAMGDYPWHDKALKWDPVTAATRAFLEDSASAGFFASMTLFPDDGDAICEDESYVSPDVFMTALPADVFGLALDEIEAEGWRGGTPTLHVMNGVLEYVRQSRIDNPGKYAVVLVTDGYPTGCNDNDIASVASTTAEGALSGINTYVIGVNNPPLEGAPDTVSNLGEIAVAGGTQNAFIIDTGDPVKTSADFATVIDQIRDASFSCTLTIPPPPGDREFDKQKVRVTYKSGDNETELTYDPACLGENTWHYDDPAKPTQMVLCDTVCEKIQGDSHAALEVEFSCITTVIVL